jgi:DNA-binding response OmpR family regulator
MEKQTILVVEDETSIAEIVKLYLERADYRVQQAPDGETALHLLEQNIPDLVVLDVMLPHVDGLTITRWLRERSNVPIIMLTARRDEIDRITGLELGADDYIVKPFSPQELVSRVRAVLRRSGREIKIKVSTQKLDFEELSIDPRTRNVSISGEEITLTAKEFDMLFYLASSPHQVFTRDQLLSQVWGETEYIDPSTVTVHIRRLREKIETDSSKPHHLQTVWGVGYKFEP